MKKIFILLCLALAAKFSFSQILLSEDFQSGNMPTGWTLYNDANTVATTIANMFPNAWDVISDPVDTNNKCAASPSWFTAIAPADRWMITTAIVLPASSTITLSWKSAAQDPSYADGYSVKLSTTGVNKVDFTTTLFNVTSDVDTWTKHQADLSAYAGQTVYLAFIQNSTDKYFIKIDDIKVKKLTPADFKLYAITAPARQIESCRTTTDTVKIKVTNVGTAAQTNIPVAYKINGGTAVIETIAGPVNPGDTVDYTFAQTVDFSAANTYNIIAYTNLSSDGDNTNDTAKATYYGIGSSPTPYEHGAELSTQAELLDVSSWTVEDVNADGHNWRVASVTNPHTGQGYWYYYGGSVAANDWAISKCISLNAGTDYAISFWVKNSTLGGKTNKLKVALGNSPVSDSLKTMLIDLPNINDTTFGSYQKVYVAFQVPTTGDYYFGFNAYSDANNGNFYFDDVKVKELTPADFELYAITAPEKIYGSCRSTSDTVKVEIINVGTAAQTNIPVAYKVNGGAPVVETIAGPVNPGDTIDYTFTQTVDLSVTNTYEITVYTDLASDGDHTNDTAKITLYSLDASVTPYHFGIERYAADSIESPFWNFEDINGDGKSWNFGSTSNPHTGQGYFYYAGHSTNNANDWVISKCIQLNAGTKYNVSFWVHNSVSGGKINKLKAAMGNSPVSDSLKTMLIDLPNINDANFGSYKKISATFQISISGDYYLGFHAYSDANNGFIYIDDIKVKEMTPADFELYAITSPTRQVESCRANIDSIKVRIANVGTATQTNIPVSYNVNAGTPVIDTIAGPVNPGDTINYTFTQTVDFSAANTYEVAVYTDLPYDGDLTNDTAKAFYYSVALSSTPYNHGAEFSTQAELLDMYSWSTEDINNDENTWYVANSSTDAHSGQGFWYYWESATNNADDWLFSKCIQLNAGTDYAVSFWMTNPVAGTTNKLKVAIGNAPASTSMTTSVLDLSSINSVNFGSYKQVGATIQVPTTGIYYLGFHAYSNANNEYFLIDDINIEQGIWDQINENNNESFVKIFPNPANDILNIWSDQTINSVKITNLVGQVVVDEVVKNSKYTCNTSTLDKGIYCVTIFTDNSTITKKICVVR